MMNDKKDQTVDENSDPNNPRKIKYDDIVAASRRIVGGLIRTPCTKSHMSEKLGMDLFLKQEFIQYTGSFKERGARNACLCLTDEQKKYGVISASLGNHALALSHQATLLGIPCVVVLPTFAPLYKVSRCTNLGAKVIQYGNSMKECGAHGLLLAKEKKMIYINGFDHPNVIEGQGTIGMEILDQVPAADAILIPCGGGGLIAGIAVAAKHLKPDIEIYGVETDRTCSMVESLRKNERVFLELLDSTIADTLRVNQVGVNTFHNVKGLVDKMVVVKEDWVARAIMHLVEEEKFVIEGSGAVTIAAIMAGLFPNLKGKKVVCVISGGNIDTTILARALERGMAAEGRLVKFKVTVNDRPGGMAELCGLLAGIGVTIKDCVPDRAWVKGDVFSVQLKIIAETRGWDHTKELCELVKKHYREYFFHEVTEHNEKPSTRRGPCLAPNPVCMQK